MLHSQQQQQRPSSSNSNSSTTSTGGTTSTTTSLITPSNSRPSSASENAALMHKLEAHAQKKQMLGSLVSQFQQLLSATNDPLDTMKERLQEMDALQEAHEVLEQELETARSRMAQVEDGAARQVRGVLDTNAKLQQELVQLSRDLTQAESVLDTEKKKNIQHTKECDVKINRAESEMAIQNDRATELQLLSDTQRRNLQLLENSKNTIVLKLQQVAARAETLQNENDGLLEQKNKIGKHVWNLTDKLKAVSNELELTNAKKVAIHAEMEEVLSTHRKELDDRARKEGHQQANIEEQEKKYQKETTELNSKYTTAIEELTKLKVNSEHYEQRAMELERDMKEVSAVTLSLRREVARVSAHGGSLQQDLDTERQELLQLRERAGELETLSKDMRIKCEQLDLTATTCLANLKVSEDTNAQLRADLRGEQQSRSEASTRVEELRKEIDRRNKLRIHELSEMEDKNQKEMEHHELKAKEREAVEKERRIEFDREQNEKNSEWVVGYENDMVGDWCCGGEGGVGCC